MLDILVLSDGKPGHENQSRGIIDRIEGVSTNVVRVTYTSQIRRWIVYVCCFFNSASWKLLKWALAGDSFEGVTRYRPKVVLSTGSSVALITYMLGKLYPAKTVICMRSGILNQGKVFDLAILPFHDRLRIIRNTLYLLGSTNIITGEYLKEHADNLQKMVKKGTGTKVGILIGGDSQTCFIPRKLIKTLIAQYKDLSAEKDIQVLCTTSRRTSAEVEDCLKNELDTDVHTVYSLYAKETDFNPVPGILGFAQIIIVTEDSYSMVSEAASSGKPVLVLGVDRVAGKELKYEKTLLEMDKQGYIKRISSDEIKNTLLDIIEQGTFSSKKLEDTQKAANAVEALLKEARNKK